MISAWGLAVPAFPAPAETPVRVFVSLPPQKYFVEQIGGDRVKVEVLVRPGQNPDTFDLTHRQMTELGESRIYFLIGMPFESVWAPRIQKTHPHLKLVPTVEAGGAGENPHRWLAPRLVMGMADRIRDALIEEDPGGRDQYRAGHARLVAALRRLDADIRRILEPVRNRYLMVYHPAWSHFARAYGLVEIPIESEGKPPGPQALAQTIRKGRELGIKAIFIQKQFPHKVVEPVARALDARILTVDPLAEDYPENLRRVARLFAEALRS